MHSDVPDEASMTNSSDGRSLPTLSAKCSDHPSADSHSPLSRADSLVLAGVVMAGIASLVEGLVHHWPALIDDAFITFRYSQNLARGHGLVFNVGERAEGYSSFLWAVLMAIPELLGIESLLFARILAIVLSVTMLCTCVAFTLSAARALPPGYRHSAAALTVLSLGAFSPLAEHAVLGMEVMLAALLSSALGLVALRLIDRPGGAACLAYAVVSFALGLTRPEANALVFVSAIVICVQVGPARRRFVGAMMVGYLAPAVCYFVCRWRFYGLMFPLPFYIKQSSYAFPGFEYVSSLVCSMWVVSLFTVLGLLFVWRRGLAIGLGCIATIAYFVTVHPIMGADWRYLCPYLPILFCIASVGIACCMRLLSITRRTASASRKPRYRSFMTILAALSYWYQLHGLTDGGLLAHGDALRRGHVSLGRALAHLHLVGRSPSLAVFDAGAIPYFSGWRALDLLGLNDPYIATHDGYAMHYAGRDISTPHVLKWHPDLILPISRYASPSLGSPFPDMQSTFDYAVDNGFEFVGSVAYGESYWIWLMVDRSSPVYDQVRGPIFWDLMRAEREASVNLGSTFRKQ